MSSFILMNHLLRILLTDTYPKCPLQQL